LMCITTALFNVFHPGRVILPSKGPEIFDTYDDSSSIPLQPTTERIHQVTETLPSPPIQYQRRSTASSTPVQYHRQSHTQSPPLQYHRQSQRSFTPMQQQTQAYRSLNSSMGSMSDPNRMTGGYNPYPGN
jgi:hypothetical protein